MSTDLTCDSMGVERERVRESKSEFLREQERVRQRERGGEQARASEKREIENRKRERKKKTCKSVTVAIVSGPHFLNYDSGKICSLNLLYIANNDHFLSGWCLCDPTAKWSWKESTHTLR